jgi:hypothetical protein
MGQFRGSVSVVPSVSVPVQAGLSGRYSVKDARREGFSGPHLAPHWHNRNTQPQQLPHWAAPGPGRDDQLLSPELALPGLHPVNVIARLIYANDLLSTKDMSAFALGRIS